MRTLLAILLIAVGIAPAMAGDPNNPEPFTYRWYKNDAYWGQYFCHGHYHPEGCKVWRYRRYLRHAPRPDPEIMRAQVRLQEMGYEIDVDGFTGPETRQALQWFQHRNDLPATGELDRATKFALRESDGGNSREDESDRAEWSRRPEICREDDGRDCTCRPIIVFSGEEVFQDAKDEALKRWRGHVRSLLGETWMSWEKALDPKIVDCWETGTGERAAGDRVKHTRCVVEARACFGPPTPIQDEPDSQPVRGH